MKLEDILTYEQILQQCLDRVSNNVDKRQGSIIYDAIAPCAVELAQMYIKLYGVFQQVFVSTASGEYLDLLTNQNGVTRKEATKAIRKGVFNIMVPIGSRFSDGSLSYIVTENIEGTNDSLLQCEQAGEQGNGYYGSLTPITTISGITLAELTDLVDVGTDQETDESLRIRYQEIVTAPEFGGNISDYKNKTKEIVGVGGCKVIPIWNGGGTVKLIITSALNSVPTEALITEVQNLIDPDNSANGIGIAPIGHVVTVEGAEAFNITVKGNFTLAEGVRPIDVLERLNEAVDSYFKYLAEEWDDEESLTVRISQIETRMLGVTGIVDLTGVTINDQTGNINLTSNQIPMRNGDVIINV